VKVMDKELDKAIDLRKNRNYKEKDDEIISYKKAIEFYADKLDEVWK
jgi:hypothetical protein